MSDSKWGGLWNKFSARTKTHLIAVGLMIAIAIVIWLISLFKTTVAGILFVLLMLAVFGGLIAMVYMLCFAIAAEFTKYDW